MAENLNQQTVGSWRYEAGSSDCVAYGGDLVNMQTEMHKNTDRRFVFAFLTILLSVGMFYVFKTVLPQKLFADVEVTGDNILIDSLALLAARGEGVEAGVSREVEDEFAPELQSFFRSLLALERTKTGVVRIAYFGDSMTEGDLIIRDLRKSYQGRYGGRGIGFTPVPAPVSFTKRFEKSPEWITHSFMRSSPAPFGVSGYVSFAGAASAWVRVRIRDRDVPLINPVLFYGRSENENAQIIVNAGHGAQSPITLSPSEILNTRYLAPSATELNVRFNNARNIPFYGIDFSDTVGVYIDNFPMRSSSGLPLATLDVDLMNAFQRELQYDLIILTFGSNLLLQPEFEEYGWYEKSMYDVVRHIRRCFPGASVLIVSMADMSRRYGGVMRTDHRLPSVIRAQENVANSTGAAFINQFELIGGDGTMVRWARRNPPLAQADHMHFSIAGAGVVAGLIFDELEERFLDFKMQNELPSQSSQPSRPQQLQQSSNHADTANIGVIRNAAHLRNFFDKLIRHDDRGEGKINIVHVGDSHIQTDTYSSAIRRSLQRRFGNGGRGFIFPYNMRGNSINASHKFMSDVKWQICRNYQSHRCDPETEIGLSGYGLNTTERQFVVVAEIDEDAREYFFNTIKIVSGANPPIFRLATATGNPVSLTYKPDTLEHAVLRGETLDDIARHHNTTVTSIMRANRIRSQNQNLAPGRILRVPVTIIESEIDTSLFRPLAFTSRGHFTHVYHQREPLSTIYMLPARAQERYNLGGGIIIENDSSGVLYHNIGVNGAMIAHYNATPLFFEQLPALSPDLVIISFGTNESFADIAAENFIADLDSMIRNIKKTTPNAAILVTTPPTSLLGGGKLNTLVSEYVTRLTRRNDISLWDLYAFTGGIEGAREPERVQISRDNVHYSDAGYAKQGEAFVEALINTYEFHKRNRRTPASNRGRR